MISIVKKFISGTVEAIKYSPLSAGLGVCCGYVYAKVAQLPIEQVAKVGAIYVVAHSTMMHLANALIENHYVKAFVVTGISGSSAAFGIRELKKRGLLSDKAMAFFLGVHAISYLSLISTIAYNRTAKK